jgi:hypothetical protein
MIPALQSYAGCRKRANPHDVGINPAHAIADILAPRRSNKHDSLIKVVTTTPTSDKGLYVNYEPVFRWLNCILIQNRSMEPKNLAKASCIARPPASLDYVADYGA